MEKKGEGKRLKDAVAAAQAYVYLLPYTNLENVASSELTKQFIQHSEGIWQYDGWPERVLLWGPAFLKYISKRNSKLIAPPINP